MEYKPEKNVDEALAQLKAKQNIEPEIRNYYDPKGGWFNASYNSRRAAVSGFNIAKKNWKKMAKAKK